MNKWSRRFESSYDAASPAPSDIASAGHQYFAFLSYSHEDSGDADWLHKELERFRVPRALVGRLTAHGVVPKRLTPIFRDRHDLAAATDLTAEIRDALEASRCLIVLCSPAAARSRWTNAEIEEFKRVHPEGCVIAAIVAGEPLASEAADRPDEECFPPALRLKFDRRGRATKRRAEPLAADLRDGADGRRLGLLKIVAGIVGVRLDELVQRDHSRRQRRLAGIAGSSLAGMVVASVLAITAVQARDDARDQRRAAESLVAFMVGDLKEKLEPIGRLDILDGVGSRVLDYYSKQDASELSAEALGQRSRALGLTAQVAYLRGNLDEAQRLYREAMDGTAEAVIRNPDDPQRLFDHAQNVFWIGEISRNRGGLAEAELAFREYKRLAERMVALEPQNLKWRMEAQYGAINFGIALYNQRRFSEAGRQFERALAPMESLASIDRGNEEYQRELSNLLAWLADAMRDEGRLDAAISVRERQISFLEELLSNGASDIGTRAQSIPAHQALGILFASRGESKSAIEQFRLASAQADRVIEIEPENTYWYVPAAGARLELARALLASGNRTEAAQELRSGCGLAARLRARGPDLSRSQSLRTLCLAGQTRLALSGGATQDAFRFAAEALASARAERSGDAVNDRYHIAAAHRLLGDVRAKMGDSVGAKTEWSSGLAQLPANVRERPQERIERIELLKRLGRTTEASVVERPLAASERRST